MMKHTYSDMKSSDMKSSETNCFEKHSFVKASTAKLTLGASILTTLLMGQSALAENSITDALKNGETGLSFRLRHENVDQDGLDEKSALTLRTRLNYKTADFHGLSGFIEMDDVTEVGSVDYRTAPNDPNNPGTPIIADPEGTEVNQAYLGYTIADNTAQYGRQRITLDNHRFVGHVGWRQNEQTYDSFVFKSTALSNTSLFYGYIFNTNRIFGEDNLVGDVSMETHLVNAAYELPVGKLTAYYYDIDAEPSSGQLNAGANFNTWDSQTYGVRFAGSTGESTTFSYVAEYAKQKDSADNPLSYSANYYNLEAGVALAGMNIKIGQEMLGNDDSDGFFITPLATLHKFQGWTDKFLNLGKGNQAGGIVDSYLSVGGSVAGIKLLAVYHDFSADDSDIAGTDDYGTEVGFMASKSFGAYGLQLKYADFKEDDSTNALSDTTKLWLTATANF